MMFLKAIGATCFFAAVLAMAGEKDSSPAVSPSSRITGMSYKDRSAVFIRYLASATPKKPDFPKEAMPYYAARLQLGIDPEGTVRAIDHMLDATLAARQDPFNLHAVMHAYCLHRQHFTPGMQEKIKRIIAKEDFSRPAGVSLNYELMRGGAGYLAAQEWPELKDAKGHDAAAIMAFCRKYLEKQYQGTCSRNASEYDAPVYYGTDFAPARMMAEFCKDPSLARQARMTLDFMLIQTGAHWHNGYHISSAGRGKYWGSLNLSPHSSSPTSGMAFLLYGSGQPFNMASSPQSYWLAHPGSALDAEFLGRWQASLPEERWVFANHLWPTHSVMVRKMAWFTKGYGLASQREDESPFSSYLFKECRRTMLKWESPKHSSSFTVLQENRLRPQQKTRNLFAYGENPYCQVMQHEGTLIGVYDVPEEYGFWISRAPFTRSGAIVLRKEMNGWVLCHGGSMLFAFRFTQPSTWDAPNDREGLDLLKCDAPRGGWILETSRLQPFAGGGAEAELQRFGKALEEKTRFSMQADQSPPRLIFRNLQGDALDITWKPLQEPHTDQCKLNGKPMEYAKFPLLKTDHAIYPNGKPLVLTVGAHQRVWDFGQWTITGRKTEGE